MTVADLSERELVARIQRRLAPAPDWLLVGIGDDAAVLEPPRNRVEVLTVDALVEGIHFDRAFVPPDAIGHRALAVNLSDLASMGAAPRFALVSLMLPSSLSAADFDAIVDGLAALAARHRVQVIGGNLTRSPGPLAIDVTAGGTVKRRQALTRAGARAGDDVYVSGSLGAAAAGLGRLQEAASRKSGGTPPQPKPPGSGATADGSGLAGDAALTTADVRLTTAYLRPEPRVRLGLMLSRNRAASSCVDLSDGLADGAHRIAEASGVGMVIDADAMPVDADARAWFEAHGKEAIVEAVSGGDDYELLFTVGPRTRRRLAEAARHGGVALTRIGQCTADRAVLLQRGADLAPLAGGFTHFA
jgi:thiamine-monophosphate kinase